MLYCVRFHKRDSFSCSPGRWCRSVQGGITIFSHAACLEMQRGGTEYRIRSREAKQPAAECFAQGYRTNLFFSAKFMIHFLLNALQLLWGRPQSYKFDSVIGQQRWNCFYLAFRGNDSRLLSYCSFVICQTFYDWKTLWMNPCAKIIIIAKSAVFFFLSFFFFWPYKNSICKKKKLLKF